MTPTPSVDEVFMRRAIRLAVKFRPSPNPRVGAVVVKDGVIVGEGAHQFAGGPHAEVIALEKAGEAARGADLYVTLEPCCHWGRTPPCADAIIESGIACVHVGTYDVDRRVCTKGVQRLRDAGIKANVPVLGSECLGMIRDYAWHRSTGLPWVTLKLAMSLDGRIATRTGDSKWITGEKSRAFVQKLRAEADAILVGANTARNDNPRLTARLQRKTLYPRRAILSSDCDIPNDLQMLALEGQTFVITTEMAPSERRQGLQSAGARVVTVESHHGRPCLSAALKVLGDEGCLSVLIEGGGELAAAALEEELVSDVAFFYAPIIIGGRDAVPGVGGVGAERVAECLRLFKVKYRKLGDDTLIRGYPDGYGPEEDQLCSPG